MKNFVGVALLLWVVAAESKKIKLYQCQQPDGTVVTQDRRCAVTRLPKADSKNLQTQSKQAKKPIKKAPSKFPANKLLPKPFAHKNNQTRSPFFTFGWDRFIPKNWLLKKIENNQFHQLLLSKQQFTDNKDFKSGIQLTVYAKTHLIYRQDAFEMALTIYHQIRKRYSKQLINSHFKSHDRFKIFNIEYKTNFNSNAFTEFYIDEANNDLFVLTILSPKEQWEQHQQLANLLSNRL